MGLDIHIGANNYKELHNEEYLKNWDENFKMHSLSREFCNFICRINVVEHEPELNQIGKITNVDIEPIYEMENYPEEEYIQFRLESNAENEQERQKILDDAESEKAKIEGNIDRVLFTIKSLIDKLEKVEKLYEKLIKTDQDSLDSEYYFSDFNIDKGDGYIRNNFGQDLRNFRRFLEYGKSNGTTTVWFNYG